jgi:molybdopterin synthase catalytic subunit
MDSDFFLVTPDPLDLLALHQRLLRPAWGGQALFTGSTRSPNQNLEIIRLEYEAYPALCYTVMQQLATEAREQWGLGAVVIAHRTGVVLPAGVSIFIGLASGHRRECLAALPWLLDAAKARLPVWKLEVAANGEQWIEQWVAGASVAAEAL